MNGQTVLPCLCSACANNQQQIALAEAALDAVVRLTGITPDDLPQQAKAPGTYDQQIDAMTAGILELYFRRRELRRRTTEDLALVLARKVFGLA